MNENEQKQRIRHELASGIHHIRKELDRLEKEELPLCDGSAIREMTRTVSLAAHNAITAFMAASVFYQDIIESQKKKS
jgi:hypothetical protein